VTRWRALLLIAATELAGMSVWFGASAAAPALAEQWGFSTADAGRLTLAVQLGFVAGTLASAIANSDVFPAPRVFAVSALLAALANAAFALLFAALPEPVREQARLAYRRFQENPNHPGLRFKPFFGPGVFGSASTIGQLACWRTTPWFGFGSALTQTTTVCCRSAEADEHRVSADPPPSHSLGPLASLARLAAERPTVSQENQMGKLTRRERIPLVQRCIG
jgi:hypothetical protein